MPFIVIFIVRKEKERRSSSVDMMSFKHGRSNVISKRVIEGQALMLADDHH